MFRIQAKTAPFAEIHKRCGTHWQAAARLPAGKYAGDILSQWSELKNEPGSFYAPPAPMKVSSIIPMLLLLSCADAQVMQNSDDGQLDVSYCDLARRPSEFSGKRIRVRAVYRYAFEIQRLEPPACCPESGAKISMQIQAPLAGKSVKLFHKFPKGQGLVLATFSGTFESGGPYGTFADRYQLVADQIENLEGTAKSPRKQDNPNWLPRNCAPPGAGP